MPMQTGQTRVFGSSGSPGGGAVGQRQNIFDSVRSWACTSIPMIVSYVVATAMRRLSGAMLRPVRIGEWDSSGGHAPSCSASWASWGPPRWPRT